MESAYYVAGIDVHKKMLAVVIANAREAELQFECRRFGTTASELRQLSAWLEERAVQEAAMESTAQYWKPVWIALEGQCRLHLAQAKSIGDPEAARRISGMPNGCDLSSPVRRLDPQLCT
jgi:hypothetical protein